MASIAYDLAKKTARIAKARQAHDELISAAHRAQADALEIEAGAKRRLADEYDAAQARGEVKANGGDRVSTVAKKNSAPSVADIGLSRQEIHGARQIRDAEDASPGVVRRVVDAALQAGEEPTKSRVRKAIAAAFTEDDIEEAEGVTAEMIASACEWPTAKASSLGRRATELQHVASAVWRNTARAGTFNVVKFVRGDWERALLRYLEFELRN